MEVILGYNIQNIRIYCSLKLVKWARRLVWFLLIFLIRPVNLFAQDTDNTDHDWIYINRIIVSGSSDESEPKNYQVYSAFTLEAAIRKQISFAFSMELNLKTESREVDFTDDAGLVTNLGSVELLPVNIILHYRLLLNGGFHPYIGAGGNFTVCWEKSGILDNKDLTPSFGPALQLGADFDLAPYMLFNIDIKWNSMRTNIKENGRKIVRLKLDPINFGVGIGFRF
jgi:outer membrane protein W